MKIKDSHNIRIKCEYCNGYGITNRYYECPECNGDGYYSDDLDNIEIWELLTERLEELKSKYSIDLPVPIIGEDFTISTKKVCEIVGELLEIVQEA